MPDTDYYNALKAQFGAEFAEEYVKRSNRYAEIVHLRETLFAEASPKKWGYASYDVSNVINDPHLSDNDYVMLADGGPNIFGGSVYRNGPVVSVHVHTD